MRRRTGIALLVGGAALATSGCGATAGSMMQTAGGIALTALAGAPGWCAESQPYRLASVVQGDFSSGDCSSMHGSVRTPLDSYEIVADGQRDIYVVVEAPGLAVRLTLVREDGVEIRQDDFVGDFTFLSTQVPAGRYRLVLQSRGRPSGNERLYGTYTLRSSSDQVGFEGCPVLTKAPVGATIQGEWSVADCKLAVYHRSNLRYHDYYLIEVPETRDVTVGLVSPGINGTLELFTRDGARLRQAVPAGPGIALSTQLVAGMYVIRAGVSGTTERETGRYTLRVE